MEAMFGLLEDLLMLAVSSRILDDEYPYQAFLTGLLMNLQGSYCITADHEFGKMYHDIRLERIRDRPNIIIKVKRSREKDASS